MIVETIILTVGLVLCAALLASGIMHLGEAIKERPSVDIHLHGSTSKEIEEGEEWKYGESAADDD